MTYRKLWESMNEEDKAQMLKKVESKMLKDFAKAAQMRENGELNSPGYKKLMQELLNQNPFYKFYLGGLL